MRRAAAVGLLLLAAGRVSAEPTAEPTLPAADAAAPWSPERWIPPRPQLVALRAIGDPPGLAFDFAPHDDPRLEPREPAPGRLALHLPGVMATAELPPLPAGITDAEWKLEPGGATLFLGLTGERPMTLSRAGQGWRLSLSSTADATPAAAVGVEPWWADAAESEAATAALHRAVAEARAGRGLRAIARLQAILDRRPPPPVRAAVHLTEARLALRESMLLIALDGAARASRLADDPLTRRAAHRLLMRIEARLPGALALVAYDVAADALAHAAPGEAPFLFALGQALLRLDEPRVAAELLRRAHRDRRLRHRARFLAHVAARSAGDDAAADAHLDALTSTPPTELTTAIRIEVALARARRAYEAGADEARALYTVAAARAAEAGDAHRGEAIRVEQGWIALRAGETDGLLESLLPIDLEGQGVRRALLVAAIYHRLCYPRRASAVAGAIIDTAAAHPIIAQRGREVSIRKRIDQADAAAVLAARIEARAHRLDSLLERAPEAFWQRQARRTRISADARWAAEVMARMKEDRAPPPAEPPLPEWRGGRWAEAGPLPDRCPALGEPPPIGDHASAGDDAVPAAARADR